MHVHVREQQHGVEHERDDPIVQRFRSVFVVVVPHVLQPRARARGREPARGVGKQATGDRRPAMGNEDPEPGAAKCHRWDVASWTPGDSNQSG